MCSTTFITLQQGMYEELFEVILSKSFVYENTLKLRSTNSKNNYIKILHKIITPLLSLIITFKATQDR